MRTLMKSRWRMRWRRLLRMGGQMREGKCLMLLIRLEMRRKGEEWMLYLRMMMRFDLSMLIEGTWGLIWAVKRRWKDPVKGEEVMRLRRMFPYRL
jgi:hypothetical protein